MVARHHTQGIATWTDTGVDFINDMPLKNTHIAAYDTHETTLAKTVLSAMDH